MNCSILALFLCFTSSCGFVVNTFERELYGAEIIGVNLENIEHATSEYRDIYNALLMHKVLVFRDQQTFSVEAQRTFSTYFGNLHVHLESSSHVPGYDDVNFISNMRNSSGSFIGLQGKDVESFHSDLSWSQVPTKITILKSVIRGNGCGDTLFLDTTRAYDDLGDNIKQQLLGTSATYCYLKLKNTTTMSNAEFAQASNCAIHPVITTHPETLQHNIYANPGDTTRIIEMDKDQSDDMLKTLFAHSSQSKYMYRHVWRDHDVLIWDNREEHGMAVRHA